MSTPLVESLAEAPEAASPAITAANDGRSLVERAEGLSRAEVMERVLGPHLDTMLRPIYDPEFGSDDKRLRSLEGEFPLRVLDDTSRRLRSVLQGRFTRSVIGTPEYAEFLELNAQRPDLLFYSGSPMNNVSEAIGTSIGVPLTIAAWISGMENIEVPSSPYRTVDQLTEIMERDSFRKILLRLTKGPNEFLGAGSDSFVDQHLCSFYGLELQMRAAFDMDEGKVVGLSGAYAVAAERRREKLRARPSSNPRYQGNDSSGCPVRHSFEDADGESQEPLVITGNKFAVAALRYTKQLPLFIAPQVSRSTLPFDGR